MVKKKLATYAENTVPLLDYYRDHGVPVLSCHVGPRTRTEDLVAKLQSEFSR